MSNPIDYAIPNNRNPWFSNEFDDAVFTIGAENTNVIRVTVSLRKPNMRVEVANRVHCLVYISTDAEGDNVTASAPSGGAAIATKGVAIPLVAGKSFHIITDASGVFDLDITESTAKTFYLIVCSPTGKLLASSAITFA